MWPWPREHLCSRFVTHLHGPANAINYAFAPWDRSHRSVLNWPSAVIPGHQSPSSSKGEWDSP